MTGQMPGIVPVHEPFAEMIQKFGTSGGFIGASESDSPWVPYGDSAAIRHLAFDVRNNSYANILWVKAGGHLGTHRHRGFVSAITLEGSWRYLEYDWVATPGSFVYETPGTAPTLVSDDPKGMKTMFWLSGAIEFFDDKGNLAETLDVFWFINHYVSHCKQHGLKINQSMFLQRGRREQAGPRATGASG
jgi:2,4'-dihydroxyacetophenone dioxygenase